MGIPLLVTIDKEFKQFDKSTCNGKFHLIMPKRTRTKTLILNANK